MLRKLKEGFGIEKSEYRQHLDKLTVVVETLLQRFECFATRTGVNDVGSRNELANACSIVKKRLDATLEECQDIPASSRQVFVGVGSECLKLKMYVEKIRDKSYTDTTDPSINEVLEQSKSACTKVADACRCIGNDNNSWGGKLWDALKSFVTGVVTRIDRLLGSISNLQIGFRGNNVAIEFKK